MATSQYINRYGFAFLKQNLWFSLRFRDLCFDFLKSQNLIPAFERINIMKINFTQTEIENNINIVQIEDIKVIGDYIEQKDGYYELFGKAEIDGEIYTDFVVEFTLVSDESFSTCSEILNIDWNEYDFVF